ncbi:MAG: TonB-dependent receptor plug domain-containing protein, partial [Myroides sp.]
NLGTDTDDEGKYTLNLKKGDKVQVVYEGYKSTTVTVSDSGVLNVTLVEDESNILQDIVVDTYRTTSKPKSNVAASTVTSKTIEGRPNASFIQTLQGQVPGLNISTGSGQPGSSNTTVILRGIGSINGNVEPLYVIDGVPMATANFRSINPNDIESVTVLKDAGATSIYGNRGANGVINVVTKRASFEQDLQIKYVGNVGV